MLVSTAAAVYSVENGEPIEFPQQEDMLYPTQASDTFDPGWAIEAPGPIIGTTDDDYFSWIEPWDPIPLEPMVFTPAEVDTPPEKLAFNTFDKLVLWEDWRGGLRTVWDLEYDNGAFRVAKYSEPYYELFLDGNNGLT
jgi:hypothetical protein